MTTIVAPKTSKFPKTTYDLIPEGEYEARLIRFACLGYQERKPFQGQAKSPAHEVAMCFELIGVDVKGVDSEGKEVTRPACMFTQNGNYYLFPKGNKGKLFEFCEVIEPGIKETPADLGWFQSKLGSVVNIRVGSYLNKYTNDKKNTIVAITPIPAKYQAGVGEARSPLHFFDPYMDSEEMLQAYSDLYPFQREKLTTAIDSAQMPYAGKEPAKRDTNGKPAEPQADNTADDDKPF